MMKIFKFLTISLTLFLFDITLAQEFEEPKNMSFKQKREFVSKLSPKEKLVLMEKMKEDYVLKKLNLPSNKIEDFRLLYRNYRDEQIHIKNRFKAKANYNTLNDLEAEQELENSFKLGLELIEHRKKYTEKFRKIIKSQQILELFHIEGKFRAQAFSHHKNKKISTK